MKKTIFTLTFAAAALTASAQQSVTYFRVQFTENLEQVKTYAGDYSTFFNPAYDYIDFKGSLPFTHSSLNGTIDANTSYYIGTGPNTADRTKFTLGKTDGTLAIKKISAYTQPVETITVSSKEGTSSQYAGKKTITYTFNALPRNIEELKTLEVNNRQYFSSPHFVTALFICCLNRITENSADAWEMINYLRTHTATVGQNGIQKVSNETMQNIVASNLVGKDTYGHPVSNGLRSYFAGSTPQNLYTPTTPYQVTVVEAGSETYRTIDDIEYAYMYVETSGADSAQGPLQLRKTNNHGWLISTGEIAFTMKKFDQQEDL
jgi:hypothetical protein